MDYDKLKEQAEQSLEEMCEKNGYDSDYVKKSCEAQIESLKDQNGGMDMQKMSSLLDGANMAGLDISKLLTPELMEQSMRMATMMFGKTPVDSQQEPEDLIIEE